ncbi:MAG: hypothetical protein Q9218_002160 [Villophora microphyllina]
MTQYSFQSSVRSEREAKDGIRRRKRTSGNGSVEDRISDEDGVLRFPKASTRQPPRKLVKNMSRIREQVIMSRLELRERRVNMREQHGTVRHLETRLLRRLQLLDGPVDQDIVRDLHTELCAALDELGPMEDDYDEKEDRLITLEYDLEVQEERFYKPHAHAEPDGSNASSSSGGSSPFNKSEDRVLDLTEELDYLSPEYRYYTRLGEANNIRERLMELEEQRDHFLEIEQERNAMNVPLYQENVDFLANYSNTYGEQLLQLRNIERDIQDLGLQAGLSSVSDGKIPAFSHEGELPSRYATEGRRGSPVTDPGKKGRPDPLTQEIVRRKSEADVWNLPADKRSNRERINQWMLEKLRVSKYEGAQHRAFLSDPQLDQNKWWELVCDFWQFDRAARSSKTSSRHTSGLSTSARPQALQASPDMGFDEALKIFRISRDPPSLAGQANQPTIPAWPHAHDSDSANRLDYLDLASSQSPTAKKAQRRHSSLEC